MKDLINSVMTVNAANDYANRLQNITDNLYRTKISATDRLASVLTEEEYDRLLDYSRMKNIDLNNPEQLQNLLQNLKEAVLNIPVMNISVAFAPSHAFVSQLADWLSAHGPIPLRLEIAVDPDIVAGAVIHFNGKLADYSFHSRLSELTSATLLP